MRPQIVIPTLLLGVGLLASIILFGGKWNPAGTPAAPVTQAAAPAPAPAPVASAAPVSSGYSGAPVDTYQSDEAREAQEEAVQERLDELANTQVIDNPSGLDSVLNDLNSPEPRVRQAALNAASQSENPDAIPALKAELAQTTDPDEQMRIMKTIQFLSLYKQQDASSGQ